MAPSSRSSLIYKELLLRIQQEQYKEGDKLPTETALCEEFKVSRPVIRALNECFKLYEEIIHTYGIPTRVVIETARDLKDSSRQGEIPAKHFDEMKRCYHTHIVSIDIHRINVVVIQCPYAGRRFAVHGDIGEFSALHGQNIRYDGVILHGAGNINCRSSSFQNSWYNPADFRRIGRNLRFYGTVNFTIDTAVQDGQTVSRIQFPWPNHQQLA